MNQQIIDFVKKDKEKIRNAVELYDDYPHVLRNLIAEEGVELTPDQLFRTISFVKEALEIIDNE